MTVFVSTLDRMAFLMLLLLAGYLLVRVKIIPGEGAGLLSKMENWLFVPALVMGTFMDNFTPERLGAAGRYFAAGSVVGLISVPVAILGARLCTKDGYIRKICTYGLAFANFGFMGNAVVSALYPEIFMEYLIFVLPLWVLIYLWGVPSLLMPSEGDRGGLASRLRNLINPMFIGMLIGMALGATGLKLPGFFTSAVGTLGDCMSPIAMLLTGMTVARIDLKRTMGNPAIYISSLLRLIVIPAAAVVLLHFLPLERGLALCTVCALAMPLGLNTIVIPNAYGRDPSVAAGMALVSHLCSCLTIPAVFWLFDLLVR